MLMRRQTQALARSAFTLMEMLVVVAILVVLAGAAVPIYMNYLENAKRDRVKLDTRNLEQTVEAYSLRNGDFPQDLNVLTQPDPETGKAMLEPTALLDPWGMPYVYNPGDRNALTGRPVIYSQKLGRPQGR